MKKLILLFSLFLLAPPFLATADTRTVQETENQNQYAEKEALISSTVQIQKFVAEYRGLEFLKDIPKKIQSKKETEEFLIKRIGEEFSREEIDAAERLLKRLALIPEDYDYYNSMIELMTEQLAGMYDYKDQFLAIAAWLPIELQEPILAHELAHALQDQHYGLENYLSPDTENDDRALALSSLVEGDATLVGFAYAMQPLGQDVTSVPDYVQVLEQQSALMEATLPLFASAPEYVKETLLFSYTYGTEFVKDFLVEYGWEGIEKAYRNPPETSEQILHYEKYLSSPDLPQDAESRAGSHFGDPSMNGSLICTNVLGEFTTYLMLREFLDEETARKGADGWDGDIVNLLELEGGQGKEVLQMTFCWDSREEAIEFRRSFEKYLVNRFRTAQTKAAGREELLSAIMEERNIVLTPEDSTVYVSMAFPRE